MASVDPILFVSDHHSNIFFGICVDFSSIHAILSTFVWLCLLCRATSLKLRLSRPLPRRLLRFWTLRLWSLRRLVLEDRRSRRRAKVRLQWAESPARSSANGSG